MAPAPPEDAQPGARARIVRLQDGDRGLVGELEVTRTDGRPLTVREIWFGVGRRWAPAYASQPRDCSATIAFWRALTRVPDRVVVLTDREPFVFDLQGEGRIELPRSFRWQRTRWRGLSRLPLVLLLGAAFGLVAGVVLVGALLLQAVLRERAIRQVTESTGRV